MKKAIAVEVVLFLILLICWAMVSRAESKIPEWKEYPKSVPFKEAMRKDLDEKFQEWRQHRIELIAWLIMKENGHKNSDCMQATGQSALNRERDGRWGSLDEICASSAYAQHYNGYPTAECWAVAEWVVDHPTVFPTNMFYFKEGSYHSWATDYVEIDGTFFSTEGEPIWE